MIPGIFETVFPRETLSESFRAANNAGFRAFQFDLTSAGLNPWAADMPGDELATIQQLSIETGVAIPALAGTFNMAHPDASRRQNGLLGLERIIRAAPALSASFVTLCTGTRDTTSMWRFSFENGTPEAWSDMCGMVQSALATAEACGITLLVEPEPANVVSSAQRARQLLDEIDSTHLKIVLDPANIVLSDRTRSPEVVLQESFDLLGRDIAFAHAKDLGEDGDFRAAGAGIVPWPLYRELLDATGYDGAVIFHTLEEDDIPLARSAFPL